MKVRAKSQAARLTGMAKRPGGKPGPRVCRICLAIEEITVAGDQAHSSLDNGICRDRAACEERQPPLFGGITDDA